MYKVNVMCMEGISDEELAAIPVTCVDGRSDNWQNALRCSAIFEFATCLGAA